ncbi:unnamed protein product [Chondrus crispus]|uniref:Nicotianamine synthase n=1 Tax=Chondrus crispus TaxID=2769 RepID=S0F2Y7_CHOCR|nr:unnamed protein product [Chondrus crispus]CDF77505.1 unnamed protein product [Chondrus crispus]|eukprot:XP_005712544.1 unnamed protein product [Chondrus crispus]
MTTLADCKTSQCLLKSILDSDDNKDLASGSKSLYCRLKNFLSEPDESLDPSPLVNSLLSELVSYLQGSGNHPELSQNSRFAAVEDAICTQIDKNEMLSSRASAIRSLAIRAESRMELFWARELLQENSVPHSSISAIDKVRMGSSDFPYTENYVSMVQKEAAVIYSYVRRKNDTKSSVLQDGGLIRRLQIAFCGSGPLPLTGILLAVIMDADITLIDCDPEAVRVSRKLIQNWEQRHIITPGQIKVICADGGQVRFLGNNCSHGTGEMSRKMPSVKCDVFFLAALVPNATKEEIAQNVSAMREDGPLVVLRTAHGLTARLAYFRNRRHIMTRYLDFIGLVAPKTHDLGDGTIVDDDVRPIAFFSPEILNSLELFQWQESKV